MWTAAAAVHQLSADSLPLFGLTSVCCSWTLAGEKTAKTADRFTVNQSEINKTENALMVWTALAWLELDRHAKYLS